MMNKIAMCGLALLTIGSVTLEMRPARTQATIHPSEHEAREWMAAGYSQDRKAPLKSEDRAHDDSDVPQVDQPVGAGVR